MCANSKNLGFLNWFNASKCYWMFEKSSFHIVLVDLMAEKYFFYHLLTCEPYWTKFKKTNFGISAHMRPEISDFQLIILSIA